MANRLSVNSGEMHKDSSSIHSFLKDDNDDFSSHLLVPKHRWKNKFFIPAENEERRFNVNIRHRIFFKMKKKTCVKSLNKTKKKKSFLLNGKIPTRLN